jgi:hypothetical protein
MILTKNLTIRMLTMAKTRGPKASYIEYGNRQCIATVEGKQTGIRYDKGCKSHYCMLPDPSEPTGAWKKKNLGRDKDLAVKKFYQLISEFTEIKTVQALLIIKPTLLMMMETFLKMPSLGNLPD